MPRFASSWQWLQHMGTIHGGNWHREVYAPASWVCPLCTKVDVSFSSPEDLSAHLEGCHTGIFEDQQLKAIVRQSLFRAPRPQETCPLCCFSIGDGQAPQANQESTPSSNQHMDHNAARPDDSHFKRLKTDTGYTERDDHTNANVDERNMSIENPETRDNTVSKNRIETRFIGSHVAAHLQIIMLLTLRLISIDGTAEEQPGSQCGSSEIGSQASWFSSEPRGLDQEMSDIDRNLSPQPYENADIDTGAHLTENVPDSEPIHWDDVLGRPSNAPQDQNVTVSAVEPLAQPQSSIEDKGKTLHDLSIYYNTIKELVDSEYLFGNDMKVLDDVYKGTSGSCAVISADDIRIIFRNSDEVTQLSLDFQVHLRQATKGVYIMPRSQHRSNRQSERSHTPFINDEHSASPAVVYLQANDIHSTSAGQAFMAHSTRMQEVYMKYLMKHDLADKRLRDLEKTPKVAIWLQECLKGASDLTTAGDLHTLLARPIHRMLNYPRIFETLLSFTPTDHPDWQSLDAALKKVTHINVTVNEAMKQQTLIRKFSRENRSRQTRILRALDWRSRKTSTISDPDSDKEYAALSQSYDDNMFQLQVVIRDMENYMSNFTQQINNFMDVIDRFDELVQVNAFPSSWSELEGKWRVLKTSIQDIKSAEGSAHFNDVLWTHLFSSSSYYSTFMAAKERGERSGKKTTENAQIFIALNETLKSELPKLYTLTARLAHTCLHNLVQIEKAWFYLVQKKLGPLIDSFSDNTQDILDDWAADFRLVETQILKLGICNGSLLENTLFTHRPSTSTGSQQPPPPPQPPPQIFGENDSSIIDTEPDAPLELSAWRDSTRPDPSKRQDLNLPRAASPVETELAGTGLAGARPNVLFLAASVFEFNIDYFRKEAGYPWLTYAAGEIFEIVGEKGELWLANNLDDPTHNLGWIWNKHFAKLPQ
ncbi:hypothetical protein N7478_005360 [Penicillium angulare]|uniref:uncharacterized protein n=1 Tax=Penicillium angulare TaxID=116970 RepID=UPI0025410DC9|nr:uncharacterized protein N7478_005360 [Penicillium angulare]KAJ5279988.1 hypothetical protein N7478_005360 [Penicillium angulare]